MITRKRFLTFLTTAVMALALVTTSSFVTAEKGGKGGGNGKPGGGGEDPPPPPPLPEGLDVRYRVQFVPIPEPDVQLQDVNDSYELVGSFPQSTNGGNINRGYYYNAATREFLTATEMLPSLTGGTQFVGINNLGWIVGSLADQNGLRSGILIYPDTESASGWSYDTVPGPANAYEYYPRHVNDYGDIAGVYWRLNADGTQGTPDAFAYNPGILSETNSLEATPMELAEAHLYSIQVSNQRRALAVETSDGSSWWFDFETESVVSVAMPEPYYINVTGVGNPVLSNDGQLAVAQEIQSAKKHQGRYTYTYTPGVVQDGILLWEGDFDGRTFAVNSAAPGNDVGDTLGFLSGEVNTQWMQHANWGDLDIYSMLVFDPPVGNEISDEDLWTLSTHRVAWRMSDRDLTGFGMIAGHIGGEGFDEIFILMPEETVAP